MNFRKILNVRKKIFFCEVRKIKLYENFEVEKIELQKISRLKKLNFGKFLKLEKLNFTNIFELHTHLLSFFGDEIGGKLVN